MPEPRWLVPVAESRLGVVIVRLARRTIGDHVMEGLVVSGDDGHMADVGPSFGRFARPMRRSKGVAADLVRARDAWEPTLCAGCGRDHLDSRSVRLKRAGRDIEAHCSSCGGLAARYSTGIWSS